MERVIQAADLFAGAGGMTSGCVQAASDLGLEVEMLAINHWDLAIATHSANHPRTRHLCESLDGVDPRKVVPEGRLDLLCASPECMSHSVARGGRPVNDQSRATAWHVIRWCDALDIRNVLIENVPEFTRYGPIGQNGRPLKSKEGALFRQFLSTLRALGYVVDYRVLCAADYGDPTTRRRLFIQARKKGPITWPAATHAERPTHPGQLPWRAAREIIDWDLPGQSIYTRKRPLAPKTMARIHAGLRKFSRLLFLLGQPSGAAPRTVYEPVPTGAGKGAISLIDPYLVVLRNHADGRSVDSPVPTISAQGTHIGLAQPMVAARQVGEPFLLPHQHGSDGVNNVRSLERPMPTITGTSCDIFLAEPYLVAFHGERDPGNVRAHSVESPLPTVAASNTLGIAQPFLVAYYGTGGAQSIDEPLDTITSHDRFALVTPEFVAAHPEDCGEIVGWLDIRFRMLQPHELAAAMSFPEDYQFMGTRADAVRQIGNAVPVNLGRLLCREILERSLGKRVVTEPLARVA